MRQQVKPPYGLSKAKISATAAIGVTTVSLAHVLIPNSTTRVVIGFIGLGGLLLLLLVAMLFNHLKERRAVQTLLVPVPTNKLEYLWWVLIAAAIAGLIVSYPYWPGLPHI